MVDFSNFHLSYQEIRSLYSELEIFKHYFPDLTLGCKNNSPYRVDNNPSFLVNANPDLTIYWKDMKTGEYGNVFSLLSKVFRCDFVNTLVRITQDIYLKNPRLIPFKPIENVKVSQNKETYFGVNRRAWMDYDLEYWGQFGITHETLVRYNVSPIKTIFSGNQIIIADKLAYVYKEFKDGIISLKTYQPESIDDKWKTNCSQHTGTWEGWSQLPKSGDVLIWTKSRKDIMSIWDTLGIPAVSLQSELMKPKPHIVKELKSRFKIIYLLYDNDFDSIENWGQIQAEKLSQEYNLINIKIPDEYESKDYSTLYFKHTQDYETKFKALL